MWLQKIITWSIFISLSPLFFHNDLKDVKFNSFFMCKAWGCVEDALRMQKIIGHFMIFGQLQQVITCSIFGDFEWFKFQNVIQEVYFMPYFLIKSKFQVEGHVWMQNIIGHFWRKIWNISKYGKSTSFSQLWLIATFSSNIHLIPFFFHCLIRWQNRLLYWFAFFIRKCRGKQESLPNFISSN